MGTRKLPAISFANGSKGLFRFFGKRSPELVGPGFATVHNRTAVMRRRADAQGTDAQRRLWPRNSRSHWYPRPAVRGRNAKIRGELRFEEVR